MEMDCKVDKCGGRASGPGWGRCYVAEGTWENGIYSVRPPGPASCPRKRRLPPWLRSAAGRVPFLVFPMLVTLRNILLTLRHIYNDEAGKAGLRVMLVAMLWPLAGVA